MQTRIADLARLLWLGSILPRMEKRTLFLLALALLLAACGAIQTAVAPAATSTSAPVSASPASPTLTAAPATTTPAASVEAATAAAATTALTALAPTNTAPASTLQLTGPAAIATTVAATTADPAVAAVLAYLDARAQANVVAVTNLSCKTWKSKAVTEAVSFRSMNAKLVGVICQVNGSAGSFTLVGCGGKMVTTYGTETRDWDLSTFVYQVTAEDGQWKMCGYH
jgi:hypothetical protein